MSAKKSSKSAIARRYAKALFELSDAKKQTEQVEKDMLDVEAVLGNEEFLEILKNPSLPKEKIYEIFKKVLEGSKQSKITENFCKLLGANRRLAIFPEIIREFKKLLSDARGEMTVELTTAVPLNKDQQKQIALQLKEMTGKKVELKEVINKEILGGLIVKMGSQMLDNSINGKLERLRVLQKQAALPS